MLRGCKFGKLRIRGGKEAAYIQRLGDDGRWISVANVTAKTALQESFQDRKVSCTTS